MNGLDTTVEIETPEHIAFRYQLAGPGSRGAAYLIDLLIRGAILLVFGLLFGAFASFDEVTSGMGAGALMVLFFLLEWGYFVVFEFWKNGQSPGKRALRLRVVHGSGRPITMADCILRNFLRAADLLPIGYCVGLVAMLFDHRFRRIGDLVAHTMVVVEVPTDHRTSSSPDPLVVVEDLPVRPALTVRERDAIALFCRRRSAINDLRAAELADLVAPQFIERFGLPPQTDRVALLRALGERSGL